MHDDCIFGFETWLTYPAHHDAYTDPYCRKNYVSAQMLAVTMLCIPPIPPSELLRLQWELDVITSFNVMLN